MNETIIDRAAAIAERYSPEDRVHAAETCRDHPERERGSCDVCDGEEPTDETGEA